MPQSKESLLPTERHPRSRPIQTWQQWGGGQAAPVECWAPLSGSAPPGCFGKPPHCRINVCQPHIHTAGYPAPCPASLCICPVGQGGANNNLHADRIQRKLSGVPLENCSCTAVYRAHYLSASPTETHNIW